ncbi:MAG TPA: hypothetical protein VFA59_01345 [Vicinamibacterales bacterium]|nr:hypothetical protein [Vicinamibacterales bacterium]
MAPRVDGFLRNRSSLAIAAVVVVVALAYGEARASIVFPAIALMAATAWLQDDRTNVLLYLGLLGVQFAVPEGTMTLPFRVAPSDFFLLPVLAHLAWARVTGARRLPRTSMAWPLAGLVAAFAIGTVVGVTTTQRLTAYVWFSKDAGILFLIAGFFALIQTLNTREDMRDALTAFVVGASIANVLALLTAAVAVTVWPIRVVLGGRLYGWMFNPSSYAALIITVMFIDLGRIRTDSSPGSERIRWLNWALLVAAVVCSLSRSAWAGTAAGAIVFLLAYVSIVRPIARPVVVAVVVAFALSSVPLVWAATVHWRRLATTVADPAGRAADLRNWAADSCVVVGWEAGICDRLSAEEVAAARARQREGHSFGVGVDGEAVMGVQRDGALLNSRGLDDRAAIVGIAWRYYMRSAMTRLLGIGLGTFYATSAPSLGLPAIIHSTGVWFLVELGPFGLAMLLWLLGRTLLNLWRARAGDAADRPMVCALAAALACWAVFSLFNEALYVRHLWLLLAAADRYAGLAGAKVIS